MVSPQPEKRSAPRKEVKVPAKVHTESGDIPAEALNLSKSGIFLECATRVSEGSPVDIVMILPKEVTGDAAKWVCCHATVRRVENHVGATGRYGVAATVDRMQAMPELTWAGRSSHCRTTRSGAPQERASRRTRPQNRRPAEIELAGAFDRHRCSHLRYRANHRNLSLLSTTADSHALEEQLRIEPIL
jgi:hypothetical protein